MSREFSVSAMNKPIYLDNAATSWPKPPGVAAAMHNFIDNIGANPGRSGHRLSIESARLVFAAREAIASLFNVADPTRVIFGLNITDGINLALHGLLHPGDHVITSSMEHNAVMRPLNDLKEKGVEVSKVPCESDGTMDASNIEALLQPNTRMIVLNHASNVCGTFLPIKEAGAIARQHNLLYLVDTAQTAGAVPVDMQENNIDLLAFTGHKSLYGPMGTGGLVIGGRVNIHEFHPLRQGGTGSRSEHEIQPEFAPDRFESGTPNALGLTGLLAALEWIEKKGITSIRTHEKQLSKALLEGLGEIPEVTIYGSCNPEKQTATIAFNVKNMEASTVGLRLDEEYNIYSRVGLHCAPAAHQTIGTFPDGCNRFGLGAFNTFEDVHKAVEAVAALAQER